MSERVSVVIPFHKNKVQLDACIKALPDSVIRHIVDDSETEFGFTSAVNAGLIISLNDESEFVLILNQDCYLRPNAIQNMVAFMDAHPKCGMAGIKQLSSKDQDQIIHGGTANCYPNGQHIGGYKSKGDCSSSKQVPWVNGACLIVRKETIREIGLMDKNFKMFASDSDWSYTARAAGWECWYIAEAECVHETGASSNMSPKTKQVFIKDMNRFRDKWITGEVYNDLQLEIFD